MHSRILLLATPFFLAGILLAPTLPPVPSLLLGIALFSGALALLPGTAWWFFLCSSFLAQGAFLEQATPPPLDPTWESFLEQAPLPIRLEGMILESSLPSLLPGTQTQARRHVFRVQKIISPHGWRKLDVKVSLLVEPPGDFLPGEVLQVKGVAGPDRSPTNWHEVDRTRSQRALGRYGWIRSSPENIHRLRIGPWWEAGNRMRHQFGQELIHSMPPAMASLACALLLGLIPHPQPPALESFRHTGAGHVLSISGLHVNLLFGGLFVLAMQSPRSRKVPMALLLFGLLVYACLSGFKPPVLRAGMMLAFFLRRTGQTETRSMVRRGRKCSDPGLVVSL